MTYKIESESFVEALDALVQAFARENPSIGTFAYKCATPGGGLKYNIRVTIPAPKKVKP